LLAPFILFGCDGGGGGGDDGNNGGGGSQYQLVLGDWTGDDLSFTVTSGSYYVNDLSVTYRGHADGNICNYDYEAGSTIGTRIPVTNNLFSYESSGLTISGEFISTALVEIDISWSTYNSQCDATESGDALLTASPESVDDGLPHEYLADEFTYTRDWTGITINPGGQVDSCEITWIATDPNGGELFYQWEEIEGSGYFNSGENSSTVDYYLYYQRSIDYCHPMLTLLAYCQGKRRN